jgi:uncharacterized membrane protein
MGVGSRLLDALLGHSLWAYRSGEFSFARGWPLWWLFALAAMGVATISWSLLSRRGLGWLRSGVLGAVQFLFLLLLLVLLWRPVLKVERIRAKQNSVAVLFDSSSSMNDAADANSPTRRQSAATAFQNGILQRIATSSDLRLFAFSGQAHSIERLDEIDNSAGNTHLGTALESVLQLAASTPLAAVVLISDGAETAGSLGEAAIARIAATGVPVHTVGVGPESLGNDLELEQFQIAGTAVAGETLRAEISIRHQQQGSARARVYDGSELIAASEFKLSAAGLTTVQLDVPVGQAGLRDLRLVLDPAKGERNTANNQRRQLVDVSARRRNVLYLEGEPRWEYKFIRRAADTDRALHLAGVVRATPNRYYRQGVANAEELAKGFPATAAELFAYDAVMIGSLEAAALSADQHQWLKDFVDRRGGSLLLLAGRDGLADGGWGRVPVAQVLPAVLPSQTGPTYGARSTQARVTTYGAESALGRLDADPVRNITQWQELPALADLQTLGRLKPGAVVLLEAVSANQAVPLLVTQRYGRGASYLMASATTWRWQMRLPSEDQRHEMFWRQLLHVLATPAPLRISLLPERTVYEDEAVVQLEAQLLDEAFKPIAGLTLEATAISETGAAAPVRIESSGKDDGRYALTVQAHAPGLYRVELAGTAGNRQVARVSTHFRRDAVVEQFASYQHRPMLERIARETGARYWKLDQLDGLPEAIRYSRAGMIERESLDLWNIPLVFLLLFALKMAEWLLRRHWRRL